MLDSLHVLGTGMDVVGNGDHRLRFGTFEADLLSGKLYKRGRLVSIQDKPFQILSALLEHSGRLITREDLQKRLWPDGIFVDFDKGLNTAVKKLRIALGDSSDNPIFIETVPREGYRFIAPVIHDYDGNGVAGSTDKTNALAPVERASADFSTATRDVRSKARLGWRTKRYVIATASCFILIAVAWVFLRSRVPILNVAHPGIELTQLTESGTAQTAAISPDGRFIAYAVANKGGHSLRLHQIATRRDVEVLPSEPGDILGLSFSPDGEFIYLVRADRNDWAFRYLYRVPFLGGEVQKLITDVDSVVGFSPDGLQLAYEHCLPARNDVELKLARSDGSGQKVLAVIHNASFGQFGPGLSWSPDGKTIAVSALLIRGHRRWIVAVTSVAHGNIRELFHSSNAIGRPVWMPDGDSLVVARFEPWFHRAQLWSISFPSGQDRQLTRDLSDYTGDLDITRKGNAMVTVAQTAHSNVWLVSASDPSRGEQITSGAPSMFGAVQLDNGKIMAASQNGLWIINRDGTTASLFNSNIQNAFVPSPCGRFLMFLSAKRETMALMRADLDGTNVTQLFEGNAVSPVCSPDGKYIYFANFDQPQHIYRMPVEGGTPFALTRTLGDSIIGRLSLSPDGLLLAYPYTEYTNKPEPGWHLAVISSDNGLPVHVFKIASGVGAAQWSRDGKSIQYLLTRDGATNIWEQHQAGGNPTQVTHFNSGNIFDFSWSVDGKNLLLTRGEISSDVVLIRNFR